jgi:hypothetical protein
VAADGLSHVELIETLRMKESHPEVMTGLKEHSFWVVLEKRRGTKIKSLYCGWAEEQARDHKRIRCVREEAVMSYSVIKYMSYAALVFGFLYMMWHLGRAFERKGADSVMVTACRETPAGYDCRAVRVGIGELRRVYEQAVGVGIGAAPAVECNDKVLELTKR